MKQISNILYIIPSTNGHLLICTFRIHREVGEPFRIRSKYTPAKPDNVVAISTAMHPTRLLPVSPLLCGTFTNYNGGD